MTKEARKKKNSNVTSIDFSKTVKKVKKVSDKQERTIQCPLCHEMFANIPAMRRHETIDHQLEKYECKQCDKSYENRDSLTRHIKKQHSCVSTQPSTLLVPTTSTYINSELSMKEFQQVISDKIDHAIQEIKQHSAATFTQINTNIQQTNNIHVNIQQAMRNLMPVTNTLIQESFTSIFQESIEEDKVISVQALTDKLVQEHMPNTLVKTNNSRGVIRWVDGDQQNKDIVDKGGLKFTEKCKTSLQLCIPQVQQYKNYITDKYDTANRATSNCGNLALTYGFMNVMQPQMLETIQVVSDMLEPGDTPTMIRLFSKALSKSTDYVNVLDQTNLFKRLKQFHDFLTQKVTGEAYNVLVHTPKTIGRWIKQQILQFDRLANFEEHTLTVSSAKGDDSERYTYSEELFMDFLQWSLKENRVHFDLLFSQLSIIPALKTYFQALPIKTSLDNFNNLKNWVDQQLSSEENKKFEMAIWNGISESKVTVQLIEEIEQKMQLDDE